jgi:hypothetical protein
VKRCFKCDAEKPLSDFYRHPAMADGHLGKCKECAKRDVRQHRIDHPLTVRLTEALKYRKRRLAHLARAREWTAGNRQRAAAAKRAWRTRYPDRKRASEMVNNAVRDGRMQKPETCDFCHERVEVSGHHWDYGQPYVVSWLCDRCHRIADHARREAEARLQRKDSEVA